jgi:hypothetical protein
MKKEPVINSVTPSGAAFLEIFPTFPFFLAESAGLLSAADEPVLGPITHTNTKVIQGPAETIKQFIILKRTL